ncbi:MAG TPA: hypothetical protein VMM38_02425 [Aridibacter sp.]|nr:hypothetical protein [Aridibacter sp.]
MKRGAKRYAVALIAVLVVFTSVAAVRSKGQAFVEVRTKLGEIKSESAEAKSELAKWREDLEYIKRTLPEKHANLFRRLDRDKFYVELEKLDKELPGMTANRAAIEFERIAGLARDGHTWTSPLFYEKSGFRLLPFLMYAFSDGIYIRKAAPELKDILGAKVLGVGKYSIEEAFDIVSPYMSTDNEMGQMEYVPRYLGCPEVLEALGISGHPDKVTLKLEKDGKVFTREIALPEGMDNKIRAVRNRIKTWPDARDSAPGETPLHLKNIEETKWFEYLPDKKFLYVHMKDVLNSENETLEQFWERVFAEADSKKPEKLVLDLRYNGGGNNTLVRPIIRGIIQRPELDKEGRFFVIIGRVTFSAAQNLTNMLDIWTNALFVGEPTGSHVNMYGDAVTYHLPNSGMPIRISELFWQNKHARDESRWTPPDIVAELSFADYMKNSDPAFEAVARQYTPRKSLREIALAELEAGTLESFREKAIAYKNDPNNKYAEVESQINRFGYELIRIKKLDEAVWMFQLNVELYPDSYNVYDSLGEAYMLKGEKEPAIKNYRKSLELNRKNSNAEAMIRRIESGGAEN